TTCLPSGKWRLEDRPFLFTRRLTDKPDGRGEKMKYRRLLTPVPRQWIRALGLLAVAIFLVTMSVPATAAPAAPGVPDSGLSIPQRTPHLLYSSPLKRPAVKLAAGAAAVPSAGKPATSVREITADRTAMSSTWENSDGSVSVRQYLAPHFY